MLVKAACIFSLVRISSRTEVALKTAILLAQIGEFALVVFSLLLANELLDAKPAQIVMVRYRLLMVRDDEKSSRNLSDRWRVLTARTPPARPRFCRYAQRAGRSAGDPPTWQRAHAQFHSDV